MADDLLQRHDSTAGELGVEGVLRLGGEGAFVVREFAVTDLDPPCGAAAGFVDAQSVPWCGRTGATHDLDHIDPYRHPDDGGPPGQTSTANTARLCRYHHRVKTHGAWHYRRTGPTAVTWTSPQGRSYTVDHTGTWAAID
jgi:hypothetical protein